MTFAPAYDDTTVAWIQAFLTDHKGSIKVDGFVSAPSPTFGLPQGSPLSPILATLYTFAFQHRLQTDFLNQNRKPTPAPAGLGITVIPHLTWLGVTFSNKRSLCPHLDQVLRKANYTFHNILLLTARQKLKAESSIRLYTSIVRPSSTYSCQAW
ncbi:hypothetical protein BOTBODRAFT_173458 [Botryobasidium botryosum FD-172 SS1]|uniref:Reverse transcriptase domain-containing protein n=1 Tax=Botryobasidium botryosum (strain FD-172 SS1) TaxID=930990 RepID=A0A067MJQ2_BOTB1|nr:hypothetical protein BOTBODRAFT_173458 [Botryobasidium botryosum FD-172 SS1]